MRIIVTTYPFNENNQNINGLITHHDVTFNTYKRKMSPNELCETLIKTQPDIIIAGTEQYNSEILDLVPNLKMISRVGIGLDSVDLEECEKRGIVVTNTPDAPSNAVAELTIGQIFNALRHIENISTDLKKMKGWDRYIGRELSNLKVGVIGCGRIGTLVYDKLAPLCGGIIGHDIKYSLDDVIASKERILRECDIITLHLPLTEETKNYITKDEFKLMKHDAIIINMSRGGIIKEDDLYWWLEQNKRAFGVVDTFNNEPYTGNLCLLDNISLTPHLGSCTQKSRYEMETGSIYNVIKYLNK